ncbi:hypothetical protein [Cyclobacterium xiamenense]|uniref:hypothetical protein n=1 Tax=Cyclobacterium xiamenense TaxID=1297121 RepID=UPI0012B8EEB1|nr:hypothetical protein [Cyclobacterium xiamenense]
METYIVVSVILAISLSLLYIVKAVRSAADDPETFDHFQQGEKFRKPANWKVGKMPEAIEKKNVREILRIDFKLDYRQLSQN